MSGSEARLLVRHAIDRGALVTDENFLLHPARSADKMESK